MLHFVFLPASINTGSSRKTRSGNGSVYKEAKLSDESDGGDNASEFEPSDDSQSSSQLESESDNQSEDDDDFNPFGGSDSDDGISPTALFFAFTVIRKGG